MTGTFLEEAAGAVSRGFCTFAGNAPTLPRLFNRFAPGLLVPVPNTDGLLYALPPFFDFPEFFYRSVCNREPPPRPSPPIEGGQCECAGYEVRSNALRYQNPTQGCPSLIVMSPIRRLYGPLLATRLREDGPGSYLYEVYCNGPFEDPDGCGPLQWFEMVRFGSSVFCPDPEDRGITFNPIPGEPNDCGDSPIPIPEPPFGWNNITFNDFSYTDNSMNVVNLGDLNITYEAPRVDINGRVNIPVRLDFSPNVRINGQLNIDGTVNFFPASGPGRGSPGDSPEDVLPDEPLPEPPIEIPNIPVDDEEPSGVEVIVGVVVTAEQVGRVRTTEIFQGENPTVIAPYLGLVSFLVQLDSSGTAWTEDIPVKNARQIISCPWRYGAIDVKGTAEVGWSLKLTPIRDVRQTITEAA